MDVYMGTIFAFAFNYPPEGCMSCNGQQLSAQQNQALYALLAFSFGGSGTTFNLPNLVGRAPIGMGPNFNFAGTYGSATSTGTGSVGFSVPLPAHTHTTKVNLKVNSAVQVSTNSAGNAYAPSNTTGYLGATPNTGFGAAAIWTGTMTGTQTLSGVSSTDGGTTVTVDTAGSTNTTVQAPVQISVPTFSPSLAINFCIIAQGLWPSRQ